MKLERYKDKKETRKKVILISLTVLTIVSVTMVLYKTFANFRTSTSFSIMSGQVKYKKKEIELGTDIPTTSTGDGLYSVSHTAPSGWEKAELRYAGSNPNNYVTFNDELWRIIGLVNVQTSSGTIEQRIKIIRNGSIGNFKWNNNNRNNWTQATLMEMLNDGYYNSKSSVKCYNDGSGTCDFSSNNPKGLNSTAQNMIETAISWNIGLVSGTKNAESSYLGERGSEAPDGAPNVWNSANSKELSDGVSTFKGIGLMYVSDYAYAVGGSVRTSCLKKLYSEYSNGGCDANDWLEPNEDVEWTITPGCCTFEIGHHVGKKSSSYMPAVGSSHATRPTVYLKKEVKIIDGDGSEINSFKLSL